MRVVYLHGFASGPSSTKARFFAQRLENAGVSVVVPDLAEGDFEHLTITGQLLVVDRCVDRKPAVLMGSSMGGYLAALYAARHPSIERLVLLAPAFSLTRRWPEILGPAAVAKWEQTGRHPVFHYTDGVERDLSYDLIRDGQTYEEMPDVGQPTLILHGLRDPTVPASLSKEFAAAHPKVRLVLLDSGHELTDVLWPMWGEVSQFLEL